MKILFTSQCVLVTIEIDRCTELYLWFKGPVSALLVVKWCNSSLYLFLHQDWTGSSCSSAVRSTSSTWPTSPSTGRTSAGGFGGSSATCCRLRPSASPDFCLRRDQPDQKIHLRHGVHHLPFIWNLSVIQKIPLLTRDQTGSRFKLFLLVLSFALDL